MDFNNEATSWDTEKRIKRAELIAKEISDQIDIKKTDCALEFGCGTGLISFNLCDKVKEITCIDIAQGMIDVLNRKIKQYQIPNMVGQQLDINNKQPLLPTYDLIYTAMALHHTIDIKTTLENLSLLLKKGGCLCIVELDEDDGSFHKEEEKFTGHHGFNQEELEGILEKRDFEQVKSHTFYEDKKMVEQVSVNYSLFIMTGKKI
jgi:ubiquinone/menaquinone biosynthesis C-methylase UbiE